MCTVSPINLVLAVTVDTGVAEALVDLGEAGGIMVTIWTQAGEPVDAVNAGAPIAAGVDGTLVNVDVTHGTYSEEGRDTFSYVKQIQPNNIKTTKTVIACISKFRKLFSTPTEQGF